MYRVVTRVRRSQVRALDSLVTKNPTLRSVSSLGPLASAFNTRQTFSPSLKWGSQSTGLFSVPELSTAEGFYEIKEKCEENSRKLVDEACNPNRTRNVGVIFDDLSDELCRVADLAEFIRLAHPEEEFSYAAQEACIDVSALVEQLNTNVEIYTALKASVEEGDKFGESEVDRHVAVLFLQDFNQCGINLDESSRLKVVGLNDKILRTGQEFSAGCHTPRAVKASVLPPQIRSYFPTDGDRIVVTGHHMDSPSEVAREAAYKIHYWSDQQQEALLSEILQDRWELAQLCGYKTFAHRALSYSLAETPENMAEFLSKLGSELRGRVAKDHTAILNMKKRTNPLATGLALWDVPYYSAQARAQWFKLDTEKIAEYFSLGVAMEGLNDLFGSLYGVSLVVEPTMAGELWSPDVYKLGVIDEDSGLLGHIYCDFFSRPGKPGQDCHFTIRGGRETGNGGYQNPVVVLMLNLPPPGWRTPALLSPASLDNLFHEMGHAMHSMLGRTKYQHVTGTRCSTDFAEVPSTLMEYFAADPRVLGRINRHYKTGEKLSASVIEKLCATKKIYSGVEMQAQLVYSAVDQAFHGSLPFSGGSTTSVMERIQGEFHSLGHVPGTAPHLRFSHLVGYGARYYSYLLARSVASAIWQTNFQQDPYSPEAGRRYRAECLSHGGGKRSHQLVSDYLGQEVVPSRLAEALIQELDSKNHVLEAALAKF